MVLEKEKILNSAKNFVWPVIVGVYFLIWNKNIVYVGSSANIHKRVRTHRKNKRFKFNKFYFIECYDGRIHMDDLERYYIKEFKPKYNFLGNPDYQTGKTLIRGLYMSQFNSLSEICEITGLEPSFINCVITGQKITKSKTEDLHIIIRLFLKNVKVKRTQTRIDILKAENNIKTDKELAKLAGFSEQSLYQRLSQNISLNTLEKLAEVFNVPLRDMFNLK